MKKRLLIVLTAVAMIVATMSTCAFAGDMTLKIYNPSDQGSYITIDSTEKKSGELKDGGTYSYDNKVLTLTNATIKASSWAYGIESTFDITIKIEGNCKILGDPTQSDAIHMSGGNLTLTGSGTLDIEKFKYGIYSTSGDVTIDGAIVNTTDITDCAIFATNIVFNGACNATLASARQAVYATNEITFNLTEGGKVDATTDSEWGAIYASAPDTIIIADNNKITTPQDGINYNDEGNNRWYIANADKTPATHAVVEYVSPQKNGANTSDSSDIAFFGIMGILALCGAGFVYKRREN